jgi:hypothetical protein
MPAPIHRVTIHTGYKDEIHDALYYELQKAFVRELEKRTEIDLTSKDRADIIVEDIVIRGKVVFASKQLESVEKALRSSSHQDLWDDDTPYESLSTGYDSVD